MEAGRLLVLLAALTKGGHECLGRKRYAFASLMELAASLLLDAAGGGLPPPKPPSPPPSAVAASARVVREAAEAFLDDYKEQAFAAAFLEPLQVLVRATGGGDLEAGNATVRPPVLGVCPFARPRPPSGPGCHSGAGARR